MGTRVYYNPPMNPIVTKVTKAALQVCVFMLFVPLWSFPQQQPAQVFTKYCTTCHNERLKTAGLVIDPASLTHVGSNAETWEKVVRKLRANTMPPAGSPRPDEATYGSVASYLEPNSTAPPQPNRIPESSRCFTA